MEVKRLFDKVITATQFTSAGANAFFPNIISEPFRNDVSFVSVLRAFLHSRMPKEESVSASFHRCNLTAGYISENGEKAAAANVAENYDLRERGHIWFVSMQAGQDDNNAVLVALQNHFEEASSYTHVPKFTEWFKMAFKTQLFINDERKSAVVFVDRLSIKKLHVLLIGVPVMLPWYFSREVGFTEDENRLLESFGNPDASYFEQAIEKLSRQFDFRSARVRQMLRGFETRYERERARAIKTEIDNIDSQINDLNRRIGDYLRQKDDKNVTLIGLNCRIEAGVSDEDSEIMRYFIENENVLVENVTDSEMVFSTRQFLEFCDEDYVELTLDNGHSQCYSHTNYGREDTKRLLKAIFLDHILKIQTCASYSLRLRGTVCGNSYRDYNDPMFVNCIPNPHIQYHACLGGYEQSMNRFLQNRNYIGAIDQCVASCKSLNWRDGVVIKEFFKDLLMDANGRKTCIMLPDGRFVGAADAIDWLKKQEEHKDEQEAQGA